MDFPERLNMLLAQHGVTAYKVSKATGISNSILSDWKSGKRVPAGKNLEKLAGYFGVSIDYLLGRSDAPTTQDDINVDVFGRGTGKETLHLSPKQYAKLKKLLDAGLLDDDEDL